MNNVFDIRISNGEDIFYVKHVTYLTLEEIKENDDPTLIRFINTIGWDKNSILPYPITRIYDIFNSDGSRVDISHMKGIMDVFIKFINHAFSEVDISIPSIYFTSIRREEFEKFESVGFISLSSIMQKSTLDLSKVDATNFSHSYLLTIPGSDAAKILSKIFGCEV